MPLNAFTQDLIGGVRTLRKSPTHTVVAVLTIALGIALNTTMFSIVQAVLLRPLPYGDADRLVALNADLPGMSLTNVGFSVPEVDDLTARTDLFDEVTPIWVFDANLTGGQQPERVVMVASVTGAKVPCNRRTRVVAAVSLPAVRRHLTLPRRHGRARNTHTPR